MGNCLNYPPKVEYDRQQKSKVSSMKRTYLQGTNHTVLPFNSFNRRGGGYQQTEVKEIPDPEELRLPGLTRSPNISHVEVETTKLSSNYSSRTSSFKRQNRYIKRYRNEEEKLVDMLQERERLLRSAITQGQTLRAKCNRYKDELDSLKALSDVDMTDDEWKKRYNDLDEKYRNMKEELDVLAARNKNGRDYLNQQNDTIQVLSEELQKEKLERQRELSNSIRSLSSVGVTDKKGKVMIAKLEGEKRLLEERLNDLYTRNKRGRDYLSKLEAEKRDYENRLIGLKTQLVREKEENENLLVKVEMMSSQHNLATSTISSDGPAAEYAKVNKSKLHESHQLAGNLVRSGNSNYSGYSEATETKSYGFEIDSDHIRHQHDPNSNIRTDKDVEPNTEDYIDGRHTLTGEPYIRTYVLHESPSTESDIKSSTPRFDSDPDGKDYGHNWEDSPGTGEVNSNDITTKF